MKEELKNSKVNLENNLWKLLSLTLGYHTLSGSISQDQNSMILQFFLFELFGVDTFY